MSTASNTGAYPIVSQPIRTRPRLVINRDDEAVRQVFWALGVTRRASPPPDLSIRQVMRRWVFFTIVLALFLFRGTT